MQHTSTTEGYYYYYCHGNSFLKFLQKMLKNNNY